MKAREKRQMIRTMEVKKFELQDDVSIEFKDVSKPLQDLFDECLNFISVNDFATH